LFLGQERAAILAERCMEMAILHRHGKSLRAITVESGTSVSAVRTYLQAGELPRYTPRPPQARKADPFQDCAVKRVEAARDLLQAMLDATWHRDGRNGALEHQDTRPVVRDLLLVATTYNVSSGG
jgi:hypothetical protein